MRTYQALRDLLRSLRSKGVTGLLGWLSLIFALGAIFILPTAVYCHWPEEVASTVFTVSMVGFLGTVTILSFLMNKPRI